MVKPKVQKRKGPKRKIGMLDRKDRVIANTAKKDIWRRQGTHRIKGGALDVIDGYLKTWVKNVVIKSMGSALDGRRRTIKGKDVDVAFATEGTAVY
jgi:histone H3/H4